MPFSFLCYILFIRSDVGLWQLPSWKKINHLLRGSEFFQSMSSSFSKLSNHTCQKTKLFPPFFILLIDSVCKLVTQMVEVCDQSLPCPSFFIHSCYDTGKLSLWLYQTFHKMPTCSVHQVHSAMQNKAFWMLPSYASFWNILSPKYIQNSFLKINSICCFHVHMVVPKPLHIWKLSSLNEIAMYSFLSRHNVETNEKTLLSIALMNICSVDHTLPSCCHAMLTFVNS